MDEVTLHFNTRHPLGVWGLATLLTNIPYHLTDEFLASLPHRVSLWDIKGIYFNKKGARMRLVNFNNKRALESLKDEKLCVKDNNGWYCSFKKAAPPSLEADGLEESNGFSVKLYEVGEGGRILQHWEATRYKDQPRRVYSGGDFIPHTLGPDALPDFSSDPVIAALVQRGYFPCQTKFIGPAYTRDPIGADFCWQHISLTKDLDTHFKISPQDQKYQVMMWVNNSDFKYFNKPSELMQYIQELPKKQLRLHPLYPGS